MIVLDASALVDGLLARSEVPELAARLAGESEYAAPHLLDLEFHEAIRGLVLRRQVPEARAEEARGDYLRLTIDRFGHEPFLDRVWELRGSMTVYDAAYVVLAEALEIPLVTTDRRLARTRGHGANIEVY